MNKIIILTMMVLCSFCIAEEPVKNLTIYAANMKPCVIVEEDETTGEKKVSGFEIDLWKAVGKELALQGAITDWKFVPVEWSDIEGGMKSGKADVAMAGLTIKSERMNWASFSMPTMNSGLSIMVIKKEAGLFSVIGIMWEALKFPIFMFLIFIFGFAAILWRLEQGNNCEKESSGINDKFFPGIFEAIYFCVVTCSTVGYGDYTPKKWPARVVTVALIFAGIISFCNFTALLSAQHVSEQIGEIQTANDLKGKIVLTQKGTTSVETVKGFGAKPVTTANIDSACDGLLLERGDAVVFDTPVLKNYVKENPNKVMIVGEMFDAQYYGFMLNKDSPLKKHIDLALLKIYEDGTYNTLYNKWF